MHPKWEQAPLSIVAPQRSRRFDKSKRRSDEGHAQVFPTCGDGVDFAVTFAPAGGGAVRFLHEAEYEVSGVPTRRRLHFDLSALATGDVIDLAVLPRGEHDCDGALILDAQIWDRNSYRGG